MNPKKFVVDEPEEVEFEFVLAKEEKSAGRLVFPFCRLLKELNRGERSRGIEG